MKERLETRKIYSYRSMLRMPWLLHVSNEEVLKKMEKKTTFVLRFRSKQLKCLCQIMRKEDLGNLTLRRYIEEEDKKERVGNLTNEIV